MGLPTPDNFSVESACDFEYDLKVLQCFSFSVRRCQDMIAEADRRRNEIMFFSKTHCVIYLRSREFTEKTEFTGILIPS